MQASRGFISIALIAILALSACGNKEPDLMNARSNTEGPDEFLILPSKPLQTPDYTVELPTPTPGGANLTDPNPRADAVAALGGNPKLIKTTDTGMIGRGDGALVKHAQRLGSANNIRQTLAGEDLEFRSKRGGRLLERAFNVNLYVKAYKEMSLNAQTELARFRALGVRTPSAPPLPTDDK